MIQSRLNPWQRKHQLSFIFCLRLVISYGYYCWGYRGIKQPKLPGNTKSNTKNTSEVVQTSSIIIIIIIILLFWEFFTPALANGFSLESEWQQVSTSLQDFYQYSSWSQCCNLDGFHTFSKSSSPCTNPLVTVPSAPVLTGITFNFMSHSFFSSSARSNSFMWLNVSSQSPHNLHQLFRCILSIFALT